MRKGKYKQLFMIFALGNIIPLAFSLFQPNYDPKLFLAIFNVIIMFVIFYYIIMGITGKL